MYLIKLNVTETLHFSVELMKKKLIYPTAQGVRGVRWRTALLIIKWRIICPRLNLRAAA